MQSDENTAQSCRTETAAQPRVSVIVLNFNGAQIIGKCLDHLLAQTYRDFEILLVDNNSSDSSLAIAESYLACGKLSIVRAGRNLGVAGGRNLGLKYVQGEIIAFIDNDGYAGADWLAEAVRVLDSDPRVGAVAPVVFFHRNKTILNGAGGSINYQGYGRDLCFGVPYEFAQLKPLVMYPMGCGMVVRRRIFDRFGHFDPKSVYYYDDTELGVRVWRAGMQVALAPSSWVDHEFKGTARFFPDRALSFEKARVRLALKHFPVSKLPRWWLAELTLLARLDPVIRRLVIRAWLWNLLHLPSALAVRARFGLRHNPLWELLEPCWGQFNPPLPACLSGWPDLEQPKPELVMGQNDAGQLYFGWYEPDWDGERVFRWTTQHASAVFRLRGQVSSCTVAFLGLERRQKVRLVVRRFGTLEALYENYFDVEPPGWTWRTFMTHLPAGCYELLLLSEAEYLDPKGRVLGIAVSLIRFE